MNYLKCALVGLSQFFICSISEARVYDIFSFLGGGGVDVNELLGDKAVMDEPVIINGVSTSLHVGLIKVSIKDYLVKLRSLNPELRIRSSKNSVFYKEDLGGGRNKRHYLTQTSGKHPVVHFAMELPDKMPQEVSWPTDLPMPASAQVNSSISFSERGSSFASFSTMLTTGRAEQDAFHSLTGSGWQSTSLPSTTQQQLQSGGVFFKPSERKVLIVSFLETKDGSVTGSIYLKPLKK